MYFKDLFDIFSCQHCEMQLTDLLVKIKINLHHIALLFMLSIFVNNKTRYFASSSGAMKFA